MFNFGAINAYITTGDLLIVALWAKEKFPNYMVDGIKRQMDTRIYTVSFNAAQHGFDKKIEINEKDEIVILNSENGGVWMS